MKRKNAPMNHFNLTVNFIKEGKQYIAYSPALDLSTIGKSEQEAKNNFEQVVKIFFDDIIKRDVVSEVLTELGWKKVIEKTKSQWVPPEVKSINLSLPAFI